MQRRQYRRTTQQFQDLKAPAVWGNRRVSYLIDSSIEPIGGETKMLMRSTSITRCCGLGVLAVRPGIGSRPRCALWPTLRAFPSLGLLSQFFYPYLPLTRLLEAHPESSPAAATLTSARTPWGSLASSLRYPRLSATTVKTERSACIKRIYRLTSVRRPRYPRANRSYEPPFQE